MEQIKFVSWKISEKLNHFPPNYSFLYTLTIIVLYVPIQGERNVDVSAEWSRGVLSPRFITRVIIIRDREDVTRSISLAKIRFRTCSLVHNARVSVSKVRYTRWRWHASRRNRIRFRGAHAIQLVSQKVRDTKACRVIYLRPVPPKCTRRRARRGDANLRDNVKRARRMCLAAGAYNGPHYMASNQYKIFQDGTVIEEARAFSPLKATHGSIFGEAECASPTMKLPASEPAFPHVTRLSMRIVTFDISLESRRWIHKYRKSSVALF